MASHTPERDRSAVSNAADQIKATAASVAKSAADVVDGKREHAADRLDEAADAVGKKGNGAPEPAAGYARAAQEKLHDAADYVHDTDARQMGRDAIQAATAYPLASLFILSAVVLGGSVLVAAILREDRQDSELSGKRRPLGLASAASGLGPKGTETLTRIRDAAFGFAMAKAVDTAEQLFPGFREHYERG